LQHNPPSSRKSNRTPPTGDRLARYLFFSPPERSITSATTSDTA